MLVCISVILLILLLCLLLFLVYIVCSLSVSLPDLANKDVHKCGTHDSEVPGPQCQYYCGESQNLVLRLVHYFLLL